MLDVVLNYVMLIFLILVTLATVFEILANEYNPDQIGEIPILFFVSLIYLPIIINSKLEWKIENHRIYAKWFVFVFLWFEVSKDNCHSIEKVKTPLKPNRDLWIVTITRLSIWHRLIGFLYGNNWKPTLLISSDQKDHVELVKLVQGLCR